jgi:hypothetical protein
MLMCLISFVNLLIYLITTNYSYLYMKVFFKLSGSCSTYGEKLMPIGFWLEARRSVIARPKRWLDDIIKMDVC